MGLENRDYLRDDYHDDSPRMSFAIAGIIRKLIAITVICYLAQLFTVRDGVSIVQEWLELRFNSTVFGGQIWRLVTYAFCHSTGDLFHLVMNMATLFFIGRMLVLLVGEKEFLWFYLTSAVFAGIVGLTFYRTIGMTPSIVGASGAVFAVFTVVAMHYPRQTVLLMGAIPMEMRWLLGLFVALDLLPILMGKARFSETASSCHLGGVLFGYLYFKWHMNISRWWDRFAGRMMTRRRNPGKLKVYAPTEPPESSLDEQVDAILEKISQHGEASLTARERNILTQASRQLRKNRS